MGYQYLDFPTSRGPWNAEKLWVPRWDGQAAYLLPPLINIADGPSGLTHDPGTGLPSQYRDHFFLADFRGGSGASGVRSFANKPKGASFELVDAEQFAWSVLATDVDFGPDGALYVSDWVEGWNTTGKGRIWKITGKEPDPASVEVKKLINEGMEKRPVDELAKLLGHADQRIRQEAQFELTERAIKEVETQGEKLLAGDPGFEGKCPVDDKLSEIAKRQGPLLARLHAIWARGAVSRRANEGADDLLELTSDREDEVRAQAYKTLADVPREKLQLIEVVADEPPKWPSLLDEKNPRVRFFAALATGKLGKPDRQKELVELLRENEDKDAYLRHAAVMGLVGIGDLAGLKLAASDPSPAVRLGVLLALRRLGRPEVATFLGDKDPKIATEAALAIYEAPIPDALPSLADRAGKPGQAEALIRRAINAANRVGRPEDASALASIAGRPDASRNLRVESLSLLAAWANPPGRDRINGLWRPIEVRPAKVAADALRPVVKGLLNEDNDQVRRATIKAVADLGLREAGPDLLALIVEGKGSSSNRVDAIKALEKLEDPKLGRPSRSPSTPRRARSAPRGSASWPGSAPSGRSPPWRRSWRRARPPSGRRHWRSSARPTGPRSTRSWRRPWTVRSRSARGRSSWNSPTRPPSGSRRRSSPASPAWSRPRPRRVRSPGTTRPSRGATASGAGRSTATTRRSTASAATRSGARGARSAPS